MTSDDFNTLIANVAAKKGMSAAIIEKDYWVCVTLDYLFNHSNWRDHFAFKGGTCLSKAYHLIERFSEDIDLILDWRVVGYETNEPWKERSKTKQQEFINDSNERLFSFLEKDFLPEFKKGISNYLGIDCDAYILSEERGTVIFAYPRSFSDSTILNTIKIEIGILASWTPLKKVGIKPFVLEEYPSLAKHDSVDVLATTPERTFWEKATILHQEALRPDYSEIPLRYSRHYYDIYCMCKNGIKDSALKQPKLLEDVALFKAKFYPRGWARYDLAKFGTLKLMPALHSVERLKKDYSSMKSMIYGSYPSFDELMDVIKNLEDEINGKV